MSDKMDILKRHYEKTSQGSIGIPDEFWTDDFIWDAPRPNFIFGNGFREGRDEAIAALRGSTDVWDKCAIIADEYYEEDDRVVVLGHIDLEQDGKIATTPVVHIWSFREPTKAEKLTSVCFYNNITELLDLLGNRGMP